MWRYGFRTKQELGSKALYQELGTLKGKDRGW